MRVGIIDDETPSRELTKLMLSRCDSLEFVKEWSNPIQALADMEIVLPDLLFVDIEMPHLNGIEFAKLVKNIDERIQIVFLTAYDSYALHAFEVPAINYILKPLTKDAILNTIDRIYAQQQNTKPLSEIHQTKFLLFGQVQLYEKGTTIPYKWPTSKTKELFAFLLIQQMPINKWALCEILWPDADISKVEHTLHSTINRLKQVLRQVAPEMSLLCIDGNYSLSDSSLFCDALAVIEFLIPERSISATSLRSYRRVLKLYQGSLFATEDYTWGFELKEKYEYLYLNALLKVARFEFESKNWIFAITDLKQLLLIDPYHEEAMEMLLKSYQCNGNMADLIVTYKMYAKLLKTDLGILPHDTITAIYQRTIKA